MVQRKVEAGAVTDQDIAVAIQNITSGGLYPGKGGKGGGIVGFSAGLDDLHIVKGHREKT
jgi:hypothetical protein